jgi:hypothetical protein
MPVFSAEDMKRDLAEKSPWSFLQGLSDYILTDVSS